MLASVRVPLSLTISSKWVGFIMRRSLLLFGQRPLVSRIALVLCYFALLSLMLLGYTHIAEAQTRGEAAAASPPASAFYRLPQYADPQISPSGHYLASRVTTNGKLGLLVNSINSDAEPFLLDGGDRWDIRKTPWDQFRVASVLSA